ncbi:MAG: P-II family nitrogen regulator [Limisphaerales bacterium]
MKTHPMKLVTIVCEAYAKEAVKQLLKEVGAHGYTLFAVEGEGSSGERPADIPEFTNVQIEVVLQPSAATNLLARLQKELFPRFGMIAFEADIRVLRPGKF